MTFASSRLIATERLTEVLIYLNHVTACEPNPNVIATGSGHIPTVNPIVPAHVNVMKGLFFVQLYGALEKSTSHASQLLLSKIHALAPKNEHVIVQFNVVSMARKWKSIKDTGHGKAFVQMTNFFASLESPDYFGIDDTLFSSSLQNVWAKTLEDLFACLGMPNPLSTSEGALVDELVDKRNAVAHGRETASEIGQRYTTSDLRKRLQDVQTLIFKLIDRLEAYFDAREFVKSSAHQFY